MIDWINEIRLDENTALRRIYKDFKDAFISFIQKDNKISNEEAIEIFQNSVIILYDNVIQGKVDKIDNIKNYLFTIGKNKAFELFRRKKKKTNYDDISYAYYIADEKDNNKQELETNISKMQVVLRQLGDPCKTLLELFYFKKMNNSEIAVLMDYQNENTVKTKKYKCIQRARKLFIDAKALTND